MTSFRTLSDPATRLGFRLPGEFEPLEAVWVTPPHNPETWPGCLEEAQRQHAAFVDELCRHVPVHRIGVDHDWPTTDSWVRDYGPLFVVNREGRVACHDFCFNGWGGKYGGEGGAYACDDEIPRRIAALLDLPVWLHPEILEGGSVDSNGRGTILTTEQCLLNDNRNSALDRSALESLMHASFGSRHIVWLPGGIAGDDTDGHIDDIARFTDPHTIVACRAPVGHADHAMLEANFIALENARDQDGEKLRVIALPVPEPIFYDFPPDRFGPGGRGPVPASYANFLFANDAVLVPVFGQKSDEPALRIIEKASGRRAIGIRSEFLVVGLGALHCLSMQQPAGRPA